MRAFTTPRWRRSSSRRCGSCGRGLRLPASISSGGANDFPALRETVRSRGSEALGPGHPAAFRLNGHTASKTHCAADCGIQSITISRPTGGASIARWITHLANIITTAVWQRAGHEALFVRIMKVMFNLFALGALILAVAAMPRRRTTSLPGRQPPTQPRIKP